MALLQGSIFGWEALLCVFFVQLRMRLISDPDRQCANSAKAFVELMRRPKYPAAGKVRLISDQLQSTQQSRLLYPGPWPLDVARAHKGRILLGGFWLACQLKTN
jgi:hypothetical protein